jgi:zinc transport system substrate-binding protein
MLAGAMAALMGCERRQSEGAGGARWGSGPLRVVVSIPPLKSLVEPLLPAGTGRGGTVEVLIPVGAMEHGYEMPPETIARALAADVVVYVGMGLEPQLEKLLRERPSGGGGRQEVCLARVVGESGAEESTHDHGDEANGHHRHDESGDPHLWLDPVLVERLIPAVREAMEQACLGRGWTDVMDDDGPTRLTAPAVVLLSRVKQVHLEYETELGQIPRERRVIITAHAAWGRLAARYGLEQVPLAGLEAGEGTPEAIAAAAAVLREKRAAAIFTEPQASAAAVRRLAQATGAKVLVLDPLGDGDWEKMMRGNLRALVEGMRGKDE